MKFLILSIAALVMLSQSHRVEAVKAISGFSSGELTFFGGAPDGMDPGSPSYGTKEGACGFGQIPKDSFPYFSTAAFNPSNEFASSLPSDGCGACFQIQCSDPRDGACKTDSAGKPLSALVLITDVCPECPANRMDIQALAFAKIADSKLGKIQMQYRRVECNVPEDMKVSVMDFAGAGGWIRMSVDDTGGRGSVQKVYVKGSNSGDWQELDNTWGAAWETSSSPAPPLDFKFICDDGEEVMAEAVVKQTGGISGGISSPVKFSTGKQFTITDPAAQQVQSYEGGRDPMLVSSSTPGNGDGASSSSSSSSSGDSSSSSSSSSGCSDVAPPGQWSCKEQKDFGKCDQGFMTNGNFCASTCGRCSGGDGKVESFAGPSGRKMLGKHLLA